jgi:hypothetical protein
MLNEREELNERHDSQLSHASASGPGLLQFIVLANILAHVVFPTPLGPQNKYACASLLFRMALLRVLVIDS